MCVCVSVRSGELRKKLGKRGLERERGRESVSECLAFSTFSVRHSLARDPSVDLASFRKLLSFPITFLLALPLFRPHFSSLASGMLLISL